MLTIKRRQTAKNLFSIASFIVAVIVGAWLINALIFRSFSVTGPSMETTMFTGDRLIVNRLPVTFRAIQGEPYMPERGHVVVFRNPMFGTMRSDEFIVKRVIGLPGDRVVVTGGEVTVYNDENPNGINPYEGIDVYKSVVKGQVDEHINAGMVFVIGDNRGGQDSLDSRNGLGQVPLDNIVGPVALRIYPLNKISANF